MHAPVSVARSTIASGSSSEASERASASTRRPSASVLSTSTVVPFPRGEDVARALRALTGHVVGQRRDGGHLDRETQFRDRAGGSAHGRCPSHVALHRHHPVGRFETQAAGVERDALADERDRRERMLRRVAKANQARLLGRTLVDRQETPEALLFDGRPVHDLALDAERLGPVQRRDPRTRWASPRHLAR